MAIRPIDMQAMIPKLPQVSAMKHAQQQQASLAQEYIATKDKKEAKKAQQTVIKANKEEKSHHQPDAKKEGRNKYVATYRDTNKQKHKEEELELETTEHVVDIKI